MFKILMLDASLPQVSKQSDLSFEDSGNISNQMDNRSESLLCRHWDVNTAAMAPALASACIARNMYAWVNRPLVEAIGKAVAYLADAAVETVRATAKSAALLNSAR